MPSLVCPELPTASAGTSQAPSAAVDNSAPVQYRPIPLIYRGQTVQINRATSQAHLTGDIRLGSKDLATATPPEIRGSMQPGKRPTAHSAQMTRGVELNVFKAEQRNWTRPTDNLGSSATFCRPQLKNEGIPYVGKRIPQFVIEG